MIKLKEAVLLSFGKFRDKTVKFSDGFQVLYGANEAGKSTLQLFLRTMLYGMPAQRKAAGFVRDRDRAIPWGSKTAEGILRLEADGRPIEIHRRFGSTPAGDTAEVIDSRSGELIAEYCTDKPGEIFFGVSERVFEKTFWLRQMGAFPTGTDEEISKRLMNLLSSGDDEISAESTIKALQDEERRLLAPTKKNTPGVLDVLQKKKEEKNAERYRLMSALNQRNEIQRKIEKAKKTVEDCEEEIKGLRAEEQKQLRLNLIMAKAQRWNQASELLKKAEEISSSKEYSMYRNLTDDQVMRAEILKRALETIDQNVIMGYDKDVYAEKSDACRKKIKRSGLMIAAGAAVIAAAAFAGVLLPELPWVMYVLIAVGAAVAVCGGYIRRKTAAALCDLDAEFDKAETARMNAEEEARNKREELDKILGQFDCNSVEELKKAFELFREAKHRREGYVSGYNALISGESIEELKKAAEEAKTIADTAELSRDIYEEIQRLRAAQAEAQLEVNRLSREQGYVVSETVNPADIEAEILNIDEDIKEQKKRLRAVKIASEVFGDVYRRRRMDFTPMLNEKVNKFLGILTDGMYDDIRISEDYKPRVAHDGGALADTEYFSCGTGEQIYFALRMALVDLLGSGEEPIFLDDSLMTYDDERAKAALSVIKEMGADRQIFMFTCHRRDTENAAQIGAAVNRLEEE